MGKVVRENYFVPALGAFGLQKERAVGGSNLTHNTCDRDIRFESTKTDAGDDLNGIVGDGIRGDFDAQTWW